MRSVWCERDQRNGDQEEGQEMLANGVPDYIRIWMRRPRELMCKCTASNMFNVRLCCCWKVSPFWSPCLGVCSGSKRWCDFPPWDSRCGTGDSRNTRLRACRKGKSAFTGSCTALGSRTLNPVSCRWQWLALDKLREDMKLRQVITEWSGFRHCLSFPPAVMSLMFPLCITRTFVL